jgi:hypothetical protein
MITPELTAFLHDGVGIYLGTRDQHLEPNGARANAVRVDDDGVHLTVFVSKTGARRLMPDLQANGLAAVSFGRPIDERACQVKGTYVGSRPARAAEREYVLDQWNRFLGQLDTIGISRLGAERWATWPSTAIRLKVTAVFEQTPGPQAGTAI